MKFRIISLILLCLTFAVAANADTLYKNGPSTGICDIQQCTVDAWTINFGYVVTDSFSLSDASMIGGFGFAFWLFPGDTVTSVDWALGSSAFGSQYGHGTAFGSSLSQQFISTNQFGYNIQAVWITGLNVAVGPGTYWVTLQNAAVPSGNPVYWDENNGPSQGQQTLVPPNARGEYSLGTVPSESFYVTGGGCEPCGCYADGRTCKPDSTPEPSSIVLFGSGIVGLAGLLRRRLRF